MRLRQGQAHVVTLSRARGGASGSPPRAFLGLRAATCTRRIAAAVAIAAVSVATTAAASTSSASEGSQVDAQPGGRCPGAATPRVAFSVGLRGKPGPLLLHGRTLWVGIQGRRPGQPGRLVALDAASGRMQTTFRLPFDPLRLVASFGSLWITGQGGPRRYRGVVRLDPRSGRILAVARRRGGLGTALAATDRWIWVGGPDTFPPGQPERAGVYFVYRIDPRRGAVVGRVRLRSTVIDLAADGPELWISGWYAIVKLSARGNVLARLPITGAGWSISRVRGGAWVAHTFNGTRRDRRPPPARELFRIRELPQPRLTPVPLADSPWQVSATTRGTWIALGGFSHHVEWVPDVPAPEPLKVPVRGLVDGIQASRDGVWVAQVRPNRLSKVC